MDTKLIWICKNKLKYLHMHGNSREEKRRGLVLGVVERSLKT
jgi:hypothetical protein